jgi:putative transcriptional regulator
MLELPDPLREAVFESMAAGRKWRFLGFGIRGLKLKIGGEGETELLRIEPGHGVAPHDHDGEEYTLVVTGAFHDGHERFGPGDVNIARAGFVHAPLAEKDEVCFALGVSHRRRRALRRRVRGVPEADGALGPRGLARPSFGRPVLMS